MEEKIKEALEQIRGALQADGGDLELVAIEGNIVRLKLVGACGSCPHAQMTLKNGVERYLRENVDKSIIVERA